MLLGTKNTMKLQRRFGFSGIYNELIDELSIGSFLLPYLLIIVGFTVLGVSVNLGKLTAANAFSVDELFDLSLAVLVFYLVIASFFGIVFGIITNLVGVPRKSSTMIVQILIATQHPFKSQNGLSYKDIDHLQSVGEIEQSSADWKSSFFSIAILWFLFDNSDMFSKQMTNLVNYVEAMDKSQSFTLQGLTWSFFWLLVSAIAITLSIFLYQFIYDFLGNEPSNRALLKACEDAKAYLESRKLSNKTRLSIKEKQALAIERGCLYLPLSEKKKYKSLVSYVAKEDKGREFILMISPKPPKMKDVSAQNRGSRSK
jgi:hypothetical protein